VLRKEEDMFKKIVDYCKACYDELAHKTTWPTLKELTHSAVVVLSASLVIALVVWVMDVAFKFVMTQIYPTI
jgi:preprotein translocase subunit SecE